MGFEGASGVSRRASGAGAYTRFKGGARTERLLRHSRVEEGSFLQEGDAGGAPVAPKKEKLGDVSKQRQRKKTHFSRGVKTFV